MQVSEIHITEICSHQFMCDKSIIVHSCAVEIINPPSQNKPESMQYNVIFNEK